nr:DUF3019 domain-containing protein [Microbulbifer sp. ALW1]
MRALSTSPIPSAGLRACSTRSVAGTEHEAAILFAPHGNRARAGESRGIAPHPSVCAVDEGESSCNVSVKIDFDADDNARYCLSIAGRGLVRCFWGDAEELKVYVNSPGDLRFQVTSGESGEGVAAAILKVAQYQPKRHRRRYGWGLL